MSRTDATVEEARAAVGSERRALLGALRLMQIGVTGDALWQAIGVRLLDQSTKEVRDDAEVFPGVGFYSRPRSGAKAQAVVGFLGSDGQLPAILATRDEATRKAVAPLDKDETAIFNTQAIVVVKKDGTIEIRLVGGIALALPTMADFEALRTWVQNQFSASGGHTHAIVGAATTTIVAAGAPGTPPTVPAPTPSGTTALRAQ